jgi:hypothetical protein
MVRSVVAKNNYIFLEKTFLKKLFLNGVKQIGTHFLYFIRLAFILKLQCFNNRSTLLGQVIYLFVVVFYNLNLKQRWFL